MNELLLFNKDKDYTSRDVVNIISKKFQTKKVGHFGTLDPLATGLLIIGIGKYTKFQKLLKNEDKTYQVEVLLGISTDTYDITGNLLIQKELFINKTYLEDELLKFVKTYQQQVPIYSATKVNGKKLYEYAREDIAVDLPNKVVTIYNINDIDIYQKNDNAYLSFTIKVSKGCYIRSIINDLSKQTKIPMCLSNLKRTKIGNFDIKDSYTLTDMENDKYKFIDINKILDYPVIEINEDLETKIMNGSLINNIYHNDIVIFKKNNKNFVAYKIYSNDNSKMKPIFFF